MPTKTPLWTNQAKKFGIWSPNDWVSINNCMWVWSGISQTHRYSKPVPFLSPSHILYIPSSPTSSFHTFSSPTSSSSFPYIHSLLITLFFFIALSFLLSLLFFSSPSPFSFCHLLLSVLFSSSPSQIACRASQNVRPCWSQSGTTVPPATTASPPPSSSLCTHYPM